MLCSRPSLCSASLCGNYSPSTDGLRARVTPRGALVLVRPSASDQTGSSLMVSHWPRPVCDETDCYLIGSGVPEATIPSLHPPSFLLPLLIAPFFSFHPSKWQLQKRGRKLDRMLVCVCVCVCVCACVCVCMPVRVRVCACMCKIYYMFCQNQSNKKDSACGIVLCLQTY